MLLVVWNDDNDDGDDIHLDSSYTLRYSIIIEAVVEFQPREPQDRRHFGPYHYSRLTCVRRNRANDVSLVTRILVILRVTRIIVAYDKTYNSHK